MTSTLPTTPPDTDLSTLSCSPQFTESIERQISDVLSFVQDREQKQSYLDAAIEAVASYEPRNQHEVMIATQLVALHFAITESYRLAWKNPMHPSANIHHLDRANRLQRTFGIMLDAYNKHRGKGQQKITVEHVTVAQGGQAIIGTVDS